MPYKMTYLCLLDGNSSIENALLGLDISKSQIKKRHLSKKFLEKKIENHQEIEIPLDLLNRGLVYPVYQGPQIEVLFEDERVLCLNKPQNIHCHPLMYEEQNNVLSFLRENLYFKKTDFCFDKKYEGGLLYRLDFETSGVLFFTKTKNDYENVRKNFKDLARRKEYICIAQGKFEKPGHFKHPLSFFGENRSKVRVKDNGDLGEGELEVELIDYHKEKKLSLLRIKLVSGIRHQIRVQLSHLGHPILGDTLYGGEPAQRLFLHAFKYAIKINDKDYEIEAKNAFLFNRLFNLNRIF